MDKKRAAWIEWAAYNMARGSTVTEVISEMCSNGFSEHEVALDIHNLTQHPAFLAGKRLGNDLTKFASLNKALLELDSQCFDSKKIPRVSGISSKEFHERYYACNRPVIIEDVVNSWPAVNKWTLEFLRSNFSQEVVTFQRGRSLSEHRDSFVDHSTQSTFGAFLDLVLNPVLTEAPPYLIAHDRLLDRAPFDTLIDDIVFDKRYFNSYVPKNGRVFFWLGGASTMTPLHRDLGNIYLAQISGRKLIRMIPSRQLNLVYNEVGYHSEVDCDNLDLDRYPLLKDAWLVEEVLNPGDLLFIPLGWWHFVKSLDTTISVTGNNFVFPNSFSPIF